MKESPLTLLGQRTPKVVIYKSESHKFCQAFTVKSGEKIYQGMPVCLTDEGQIEPFKDGKKNYLGIALTSSETPAYGEQRNYPVEVTVMMRGYAIVNWVSNGTVKCGPVIPSGDVLNGRFVKANQGIEEDFLALNPADEANEVIQVLVR